jgi:DNA-binding GntR family transcriptional regulator
MWNFSTGKRVKVPAVSPRSLEQQAADAIRDGILSGHYAAGSRLTELSLVADLGLSRGTIRGALQQLSFEGLVSLSPYKGWSVIALSSKDAWEIYTLRNALEGLASRLVSETITDEKATRIDAAFALLKDAVGGGRRDRIVRADFNLHRTIIELSGHARLLAQYQVIEKQTQMFFAMAGAFLQVQDYVDLHVQLIEAIKSGNSQAAERIASDHNTIDGAALVEKLKRSENRVPRPRREAAASRVR